MGIRRLRIYGVGVDVVRIARIQQTYERFGKRFLLKAFHADEIAQFHARTDAQKPLFLASRWAVKEATFKAFQRYRVLFPEICTVRQRSAPRPSELLENQLRVQIQTALPVADEVHALVLQFHGETAKLALQLRLEEPHVSLSHDGDYAMAVVVLQQQEADEEQSPSDP